jgi:uncharacterized membrane protein YccC
LNKAYKKLQQFLDEESLEPALGWGLRMAFSLAVPIILGIQTGHTTATEWIALTAECICWVALKGTYAQRLRIMAGGTALALIFAVLGNLTGHSLVLSIIGMMVVAFISGLFKNLGDRGSGLSICVYLMFLLNNAHPVMGDELVKWCEWILIGGAWHAFLGIASFILLPAQQPYRRTIALIWKANATLIHSIGKGWDGKSPRSNQRAIYLNEKAVRMAIDQSFVFHERMAHQVTSEKNKHEYQLAQVRKAAALVATSMGAINEELENINRLQLDETLRLKISDLFKALEQTADRMAVFILSKRTEEELLVDTRLQKLNSIITVLKEHREPYSEETAKILHRIIHLTERLVKLIEASLDRLDDVRETSIFRSYSLIKTVLILHPKHWLRNLRLLFNINSHTMRYVLRTALVAGIAMAIWKIFDIQRGYWIAFTVIIVLQPYFGATIQKARDRTIGTVLGGIAGGLFLLLPTGLHMKEIMLFISAISMMYFFRSRYSVASFFITLNLVLLFSVSAELNRELLIIRSLSTLGGATLAVVAGFILLPAWDKKWLPRHLAAALHMNYDYFVFTFITPQPSVSWTKSKRMAETENSNAFDSFNRYMQEPGVTRKAYSAYYQFITHSVRLTRELNNIHLEQDGKDEQALQLVATPEQELLVAECLAVFNKVVRIIPALYKKEAVEIIKEMPGQQPLFHLSPHQVVYLEKMIVELKALRRNLEDLAKQNQIVISSIL